MNDLLSLIPKNSIPYIKSLTENKDLNIKIVNKRKTKHGDFRKFKNRYLITINYTENKYLFLLVLIHEVAHYVVFKNNIKTTPHGIPWKNEYHKLLAPVLNNDCFPVRLLELLKLHMINPKSSFSYDSQLVKELNKYENDFMGFTYLDNIDDGSKFLYEKDKIFKKIKKRRKRYLCIDTVSKRKYLFLPHAKVELI